MEEPREGTIRSVAKPPQILALAGSAAVLFSELRCSFDVPDVVELDLRSVSSDSVHQSLRDRKMIAALAMRKLQALHYIAQPGVPTRAHVVLTLTQSVLPALVEVPLARLNGDLERVDWDHEWGLLDAGLSWRPASTFISEEQYRSHVRTLVDACHAAQAILASGNPEIA